MSFLKKLKALFGGEPDLSEPNPIHEVNSNSELNDSVCPEAVLMSSDDHHLTHFGKADDGLILWMGGQLKYDHDVQDTTDYIFKFLFDTSGELVSSDIQTIGARKVIKPVAFAKKMSALINANEIVAPVSAMIKTFTVVHEGIEFGLIVRVPEDEEDVWAVEFMPGNTMAFFEPFDSGSYDT